MVVSDSEGQNAVVSVIYELILQVDVAILGDCRKHCALFVNPVAETSQSGNP